MPYTIEIRRILIVWLGGWVDGWGVFTFWYFWPCWGEFFQVFSVVRCLAWRGNDFKIGLSTFETIFEVLGPKYTQKSTFFAKVGTRVLTILGGKKVVFWTFGKLFKSCSGFVKALFLDLKGPFLGVFLAQKVDNWPWKSRFFVKIWPFWDLNFDHFGGRKSHFLDFFKVVLELFRKY